MGKRAKQMYQVVLENSLRVQAAQKTVACPPVPANKVAAMQFEEKKLLPNQSSYLALMVVC